MAHAIAIGLDWLGEAMTDEQLKLVRQVGADYVRVIVAESQKGQGWMPYHNWSGVVLGGAGGLALKLREAYPAESKVWLEEAERVVAQWFDKGFDEQGASLEGAMYPNYGMWGGLFFADALLRSGGPNLFERPRLRKLAHYYAMSLLPGEAVFDAQNDANYVGFSWYPFMLRLAGAYRSGLAKWLHERCYTVNSPFSIIWANDVESLGAIAADEPLAEHFAGRGLCIFRTGWKAEDVMFSIEAGRFHQVTHNQADKGHFTLYGLGSRWAIDSGYGNNLDPEGTAQTLAHNCILIDGKGQALSGASIGTSGKILAYENNDRYGYALADATEAYNINSRGDAGVGVEFAKRHVLFMRPKDGSAAYVVILDDIRKDDQEHDYTWLLHTDSNVELRPGGAVITPQSPSGGASVETPVGEESRGECTWKLDIREAGRYIIWARVRGVGPELGKSDSFFVQMDDGKKICWHTACRAHWVWRTVRDVGKTEPLPFDLSAGEHTLRFLTREPGTQVGSMRITADLEAEPPFLPEFKGIALEAEDAKVTAPMRVVREERDTTPARMKLAIHSPSPVTLQLDGYDRHPRIKVTTRAIQPDFAAVLLPLPGEVTEPDVAFKDDPESLRITIQWPRRKDVIEWPRTANRRPRVVAE